MRLSSLALSALLIAPAACGHVVTLADAPPATIDGTSRGTVKVTVLDPNGGGIPTSGVQVVFIDPDGTQAARVPTDTNGHAQAEVLPGASVTAVWPASQELFTLESVLGVKPGDDIRLTFFSLHQDSTEAGTFTVNLMPPGSGTYAYDVYGPCGETTSNTPAVTMTIFEYCKTDTMELLAEARDVNGGVVGTVDMTGVAFIKGGSVTMPKTWTSNQTFNASYTNVTPEVSDIQFKRYVPPNSHGYQSTLQKPTAGATTLFLSAPGPAGGTASIETRLDNPTGAYQLVHQSIPGNGFSYGFDVGGNLLPWLGAVSLDTATGIATVPVQGTAAVDGFGLVLSYERTTPGIDAAGTKTGFQWLLWGAAPGNVTLPHMPPEVGPVNPMAGDVPSSFVIAIAAESDQISGYDAIRNDPFAALNAIFEGTAPGTGRLTYSPSGGGK
jgi:hypothetical protein